MLCGVRLPLLVVSILYDILVLLWLLLVLNFIKNTDLMLLKLKDLILTMSISLLSSVSWPTSCMVFHLML